MLRALLATQMRYPAATRLAARIGQVIAVLFGLASLTPWAAGMLGFIAIFVFSELNRNLPTHSSARRPKTARRTSHDHPLPGIADLLERVKLPGRFLKARSLSLCRRAAALSGIASREELQRAATQLPGGLRQFRRAHSSDVDSKHGFR